MQNLKDKLEKIAIPHLSGKAKTIADFYNIFIEPYLPDREQVIRWHKILKEYVKKTDENLTLGFRAGNTAGKLRRGWETATDDNYHFFYTDNFFAHYFYKLACDTDYKLDKEEFFDLMTSKDFPVRFKFPMGKKEKKYASFKVDGKNPGLNLSGYKLAHIIDAGQDYYIDGKKYGMADILKDFFPLGEEKHWNKNNKFCRKLLIKEEDKKIARQLAEMSFLRMVHPMNYFLSPKAPNQGHIYNYYKIGESDVYKYDIGEEKKLIAYVHQQFHKRYKVDTIDYFQEFVDLVGYQDGGIKEDGKTEINITYSLSALAPKMTEEQEEFYKFLKRNKTPGALQLVTVWPEKLKEEKEIDIYEMKDKTKEEKEEILNTTQKNQQ